MLQCDGDCLASTEQPLLPCGPGAPRVLCPCKLLWTTRSSPVSKSRTHQICCLPSPHWTFIRLLSLQQLRQWGQFGDGFLLVLFSKNLLCLQLVWGFPWFLSKMQVWAVGVGNFFSWDVWCSSVAGARTLYHFCHRYMGTWGKEERLEMRRGGFHDVRAWTVGLARKAAVRRQLYYWQKPFLERSMILSAFSWCKQMRLIQEEARKPKIWGLLLS